MRMHFTSWHRRFMSVALGALVLLVAGAVALTQERGRPRFKDDPAAQAGTRANAPADAPNARMVALVRSPDAVVVLQKNVRSVRRIATGVYCIRPEPAAGIDPQTAVAVVSVEYFYSQLNEVMVQWARRQNGCGNERFGVYTLDDFNLDARYTFSNRVGFTIYVP
jgi:hypothetical protein